MKAKRKAPRKKIPRGARGARPRPLDNSAIRMPSETRRLIRARQREAVAANRRTLALLQATCESQEERKIRERVMTRIASALGVHDDLVKLREMSRKRRRENFQALAHDDGIDIW